MRKLVGICLGVLLPLWVTAQPVITLRLVFNAEQNRYEILARSNVTTSDFSWGPSQVSVVFPAELSEKSISSRSTVAGIWVDNSVVTQPIAAPTFAFHGFSSQGGKVDLVAGEERLLFDFMLKQGYLEGIRLFDSQKDPTPDKPGMNGGDFRSYISNERGDNLVQIDTSQPKLVVKEEAIPTLFQAATDKKGTSVRVVAYPNPSPTASFRLFLQGFDANEKLTVQLTTLTGKIVQTFSEKVETLAGKSISAAGTSDAFLVLSVTRPERQQTFAQKIWLRD